MRQSGAWKIAEQVGAYDENFFAADAPIRCTSQNGAGWSNVLLGELRVYNYPLSTSELDALNGALIAKRNV